MDFLLKSFTRKKVVDPRTLTSTQLSRCLSIFDLTVLGVGSTLGAGIYVLAGDVARNDAGPGIVISFAIAAIASILSGLCYGEFGARVPKAGSAYVYSYVAIGELCAFVIGWNLILEYVIGTSSVARAWSAYFDSLFDGRIKNFTISTIGEVHVKGLAEYLDVLSVLVILGLTVVLLVGIKKTAWFNTVFTSINMFVIVFIVCVGAYYAEHKNWSDFAPYGASGILAGAATCFYAFVGFDIIATTGEEARNPSKGIPISIVLALSVCFLAYFGVSAVMTLMWPYKTLPEDGTLPNVFALRGAPWAKYIIAVGALCGLTSSLLGALVPLPRMLYSMASDGVIFKFLAKVNPRTEIPMIATVLSGVLAAVLAFIFDLHALVEMMSIGTLLAYTIVAVCVLILRYQPGTIGLVKQPKNPEESLHPPIDGEYTSRESLLSGDEVFRNHSSPSERSGWLAQITTCVSCIISAGLSAMIIWGSQDIVQAKWWAIIIVVLMGLGLIGTVIVLLWLPQNKTPLAFKVPFVPILPQVSIFINIFLILKLSYLTWVRFAVWMVIGMSIYLFYGLRHSVEGERQRGETHTNARSGNHT